MRGGIMSSDLDAVSISLLIDSLLVLLAIWACSCLAAGCWLAGLRHAVAAVRRMLVDGAHAQRSPSTAAKSSSGGGGAGALSSLVTLMCGQLGAGILSLPYAAALIGAPAAAALIALMAGLNVATLRFLVQQVDHHRADLLCGRDGASYERLVHLALGPHWGKACSGVVLLAQWGSLVGFLVILVGLAVPVVQSRWGGDHVMDEHEVVKVRAALAFSLALLLLFPLSLYQAIHKLACVSVMAIAAVLWTAGVLIALGLPCIGHESVGPSPSAAGHDGECESELEKWLDAVPIIVFAFNCHQQLVPIHGETNRTARRLMPGRVIPAAVCLCCALYVATAVSGSALFGAAVPGNVLLAFDDGTAHSSARRAGPLSIGAATVVALGDSAKLLMAAHIALAYPVVLFPLLRALDTESERCCEASDGGGGGGGGDSGNSDSRSSGGEFLPLLDGSSTSALRPPLTTSSIDALSAAHDDDDSSTTAFHATEGIRRAGPSTSRRQLHALRNLMCILSTAACAVFVPKVQDVFSVVGGLFGSLVVFVFPCCTFLSANHPLRSHC
jgi:amino acid permease